MLTLQDLQQVHLLTGETLHGAPGLILEVEDSACLALEALAAPKAVFYKMELICKNSQVISF